MDNHQLLLQLYNELDAALRLRYRDNNRSDSVIIRYVNDLRHSGNDKFEKIGKKLNMIRILRNDLVHELDMNSESLIEVTDEAITFLRDMIYAIKHPKRAIDFCTPLSKLYCVYSNSDLPICKINEDMRNKGFSQVPVIDKANRLVGVYSPNVLFEYLSKHNESSITKLNLNDLVDYIPCSKHFSETYTFVKEDANEEELDYTFLTSYEKGNKLVMLFVTKTGSEKEPIKGIIVPKDLISE